MKEKKGFFVDVIEYFNKQSNMYLLTRGFIITICIGVVDYKTGHELSFSIFYLLPISLVVWFANRNCGIFMSILSSATEYAANYLAGRNYSHPLISLWNSSILLGFFFISVFILSILKMEYKRRINLIVELKDTVTKLELSEEELEQRSQDLARSNAELEQFASAASYDLKEPLLAITIDLKLLRKRYEGKLDPIADKFILEAIDEAKWMQTLISYMLLYSHVGTSGKPFLQTDCNAITNPLSNLRKALEESGAIVTKDPLPVVMADPIQLNQLLQNLISNAIKFHGEEKSHIHISAESKEKKGLFSVSDNGIGIPEEHRKRIFEIFQRLHNKKEYPGTGIGLATCKKIVERHGGRIWVESEIGKGLTFYFTIPDRVISA